MAEILNIGLDISAIITEELEQAKSQIVQNSTMAGQRASGKTYRSMRIEVLQDSDSARGILSARPFFAALETGSKPWANQYRTAPKFFADIIEEWINDKGLTLNPYAVATTIMRKGSKIYRQGGRSDIITPVVESATNNVAQRTAGLFQTIITDSILKYTKPSDTL